MKAIQHPPEAYDRIPRLAITFTDESVWLTKFDSVGRQTVTYPASVKEVGNAFKDFGASTGLLPPETLWWTSRSGQTEIAMWLPPVKRTVLWAAGRKVHKIVLPPLGFVWIGCGTSYGLFAAARRPVTGRDMLYHAPLPNIHPDGHVCPGNVAFPKCEASTIAGAATMFWESHFNHDLSQGKILEGDNLMKDLQALAKARAFPADRLVPAISVDDLLNGNRRIASLAPDPDEEEEDEDNDELG